MNRRGLLIGGASMLAAGAAVYAMPRSDAATGVVTLGTPTPVPTPDDPGLCGSAAMRRRLIRQRIANLRAEIAGLRAALDDCA